MGRSGQFQRGFWGPRGLRVCVCPESGPTGIAIATTLRSPSTVKVWDATGRLLLSLKCSMARDKGPFLFQSLHWSACGGRLAYVGYGLNTKSAGLTVWDRDGKELLNFDKEGVRFYPVTLSPDGQRVAASLHHGDREDAHAETRIWDVATGRPLASIPGFSALTFNHDGHAPRRGRLLEWPARPAAVWDAVTGSEYANWELPGAGAFSIAFSPDEKRIAATVGPWKQQELIVWEVESGKFRKLGQAFKAVTFSPDGKRIAAFLGSGSSNQTAEVGLWDAASGRQVLVLKGHDDRATPAGIVFLPGGDQILSVAELSPGRGTLAVRLWDATPWPEKAIKYADANLEACHLQGWPLGHEGRPLSAAANTFGWQSGAGIRSGEPAWRTRQGDVPHHLRAHPQDRTSRGGARLGRRPSCGRRCSTRVPEPWRLGPRSSLRSSGA